MPRQKLEFEKRKGEPSYEASLRNERYNELLESIARKKAEALLRQQNEL